MRYWVDSFRLPKLSPAQIDAGFAVEGYDHIERAVAVGHRPDPRPAPPRRMGVGRLLADRRCWASRSPRWSRRSSPRSCSTSSSTSAASWACTSCPLGPHAGTEVITRHQGRPMSSACCPTATSPATASRSSSSASARRCPVARSRSPCGPGAPLLPTAVYFEGRGHHAVIGPPLPLERRGRLRADVGPPDPGPGRRARGPDPPGARAVAPPVAELAERLRRAGRHRPSPPATGPVM